MRKLETRLHAVVIASIATSDWLYRGVWYVDQMYTSTGPTGSPPYPPADIVLRLHAFG
jgi:hypothetical protein